MTTITYDNINVVCHEQETVLDALLRDNIQIPHGCRQGVCQSCLMRSLDKPPPASAQRGLKDTWQAQNYFLACLCQPEQAMTVALPDLAEGWMTAQVLDKELLNHEVVRLLLKCAEPLSFFPGQFVNLRHPESGMVRSYSIANLPHDDHYVELHIRRLENGQFSSWVHDELQPGMAISLSSAQGACYYLPGRAEQPLLLIGTGTGLAPLYGIIHDALLQGHQGAIHLYHGSSHVDKLYWVDKLRDMTAEFSNFYYTPCVSKAIDIGEGFGKGRAHDLALTDIADLKGWRVYLCGHPEMVNQTKRMAYLKGAALKDIYADPFHVAQTGT